MLRLETIARTTAIVTVRARAIYSCCSLAQDNGEEGVVRGESRGRECTRYVILHNYSYMAAQLHDYTTTQLHW